MVKFANLSKRLDGVILWLVAWLVRLLLRLPATPEQREGRRMLASMIADAQEGNG